jgi:hypothetical protein
MLTSLGSYNYDCVDMATTLDELPTELLVRTCEMSPWPRDAYSVLRATSKTLNYKIVSYYGQECFREVKVLLNAFGMKKLWAISSGGLAFHVQSIIINTDTLIHERGCSEPSDANHQSWYDENEWEDEIPLIK